MTAPARLTLAALAVLVPSAVACSSSTHATADGGTCTSAPVGFPTCSNAGSHCTGPTACRSCGSGLWALTPAWDCACGEETRNGSTSLHWQCPSVPVCSAGAGTFRDDQCTVPSFGDGGAGTGGAPGTGGGAGGQAGGATGGHGAGGTGVDGGGAGGSGLGGGAGDGGAAGSVGGGGAGGAGTVCGGIAGLTCGLGEFCDFGNGQCGAGDQQGQCAPAGGAICAQQPVCGCDGRTYVSACAAHDNGVDTMSTTSCIPGNGGTGAPCGHDSDCMSGYKCCVTGGTVGSPIACRDVGTGSCPALP